MSDSEDGIDMFKEPEGFYEPEKEPTFEQHRMLDGQLLTLRLVGSNPLWGHFLWNAGRTLADYIENDAANLIVGKTVLELGAGAGLPSLICALKGASMVLVTDYPDADLIENLQYNIDHCEALPIPRTLHSEEYLWGASPQTALAYLADQSGYDILILADLLFNHSEHSKLVQTVQQTLKRTNQARALVFFTPYRPWLLSKDLDFFRLATEGGFVVEKTFEKVVEKVMFEKDPGDEQLRRTVFGYELRWDPKDINQATETNNL